MKVISFSLWGEKLMYTIGALRNAEIAEKIFPDWECWFYIGSSCPNEIIDELKKKKNTKVFEMSEEGDWNGMFWRFYPASDPNVDVMLSRDTDCRLSVREKEAVDEWLDSDKDFHIMRDHPFHRIEILGGMWGVRGNILSEMTPLIGNYIKGNFWQVDQNFLKQLIYPIVKDKSFVHDEFFEMKPFPSDRKGKEFVGEAFDENNKPLYPEHGYLI